MYSTVIYLLNFYYTLKCVRILLLFCYYDVFMVVLNFIITTSISCVQCYGIFIIDCYFYYTLKCVRIILLFCYYIYNVLMSVLNYSPLFFVPCFYSAVKYLFIFVSFIMLIKF